MKAKKHTALVHNDVHHDIMIEGMMLCIKVFALSCMAMSVTYFAIESFDKILRFFSL